MFTALLIYKQVQHTRSSSEFTIYLRLREQFSSSEFNDSLYRLKNFQENNKVNFIERWFTEFEKGVDSAVQLNSDRRNMMSFAKSLEVAYKNQKMPLNLISDVITGQYVTIYLEICLPMHAKLYGFKKIKDSDSALEEIFKSKDR